MYNTHDGEEATFASEFDIEAQLFREQGGRFFWHADEDFVCTVAYKTAGPGMTEVAVAHCNPNDEPDESIGRAMALQHFLNGKTVLLRRNEDQIKDQIKYLAKIFSGWTVIDTSSDPDGWVRFTRGDGEDSGFSASGNY